MSTEHEEAVRRGCVWAHASALLGLVLPFGQLLGPYLVLLLAPRNDPAPRAQAIEALNFHLNMLVVLLAFIATCLLLRAGWGWFAIFIPNLYTFGMALVAATRASRGRAFRYPFIVRVLSAGDQTERPARHAG